MKSLRQLQREMSRAITEGNNVVDQLGIVGRSSGVDRTMGGPQSSQVSVRSRLKVYQEFYQSHLGAALRDDFPSVLRLLGKREFARIVAQFLREHPSRVSSLSELGRGFAEHFSRNTDSGAGAQSRVVPGVLYAEKIVRAAERDWASMLAYYARDLEPGEALSPAEMEFAAEHLVLALHPSVQVLPRWRRLIWRRGLEMFDCRVSQSELEILGFLSQSLSVTELADRLHKSSAKKLSEMFFRWVQEGVIYAKRVKPSGYPRHLAQFVRESRLPDQCH